MEAPYTIPEKNEPVIRVSLRTLLDGGKYQIDDLTGATVNWISKPSKKSETGAITVPGSIVNPSTDPVAVIQLTAPVTATAGEYFYRIDVTLNGHPLTYRYGPLTIAST